MSETYFSKTDSLNDMVIIRSLSIIMVVAFHAYYMMMVEGLSNNVLPLSLYMGFLLTEL